ncbi:alpha/beta hydrolase [Micromonospora sp. WMMA1363]|uniref:alpha/beta hydrolase family protein n=1 Tax=Micromonospora sp. WMMA1363 TaxID=3053985 RepID=UPI00259C7232|nr:CocE/NonD family hydrolase [Micromonospora sp. WMMA1363]MDM4720373.1 alpha/beta hydrolase [Micromonospora sp. WMMA1363]
METPAITPRRQRRRRLLWVLTPALLALVLLGGVVVLAHRYDIREQRVEIQHDGLSLDGVLATPSTGDGPFGLVVFVHGDGPVDATADTFYRPLWESFAHAGYASLSWNKPGVAGSAGNWLDQTMADRAQEVAAALAWGRQHPSIDRHRIGLWGASQAGWVLPRVAAETPDLQFVIAVSPAINWLRQGRYHLLAQLRAEGAAAAEVDRALRRRERTLTLLRRGATVEEYRTTIDHPDDTMTADRWTFITRNHTADATDDLRAMRGTPVLLLLAGHDNHVDVTETETVYRQLLPAATLHVKHFPDADHRMVRHRIARSALRATLTALVAPRTLFADGYLTDQRQYLQHHTTASRRQ